eukprot:1158234-Pelagomonas_calceolata.AAC.1
MHELKDKLRETTPLEVEARNRELQAAANAAAADTTEVTTLVEQHRDLVEKHQQLEDKMAASEAELVQARAAAAEAVSVKADAEAQAVEVQRLQVRTQKICGLESWQRGKA